MLFQKDFAEICEKENDEENRNHVDLIDFFQNSKNQRQKAPINYSDTQLSQADRSIQQAYERYVLAQFQFKDQKEIDQQRKNAIESLIPGTLNHFHLFFLDLVKRKQDFQEFSNEEKELYQKFQKKFGSSCQFYEVETKLKLLNQLEKIPNIDEKSTQNDINKLCDVLKFIENHFKNRENLYVSKPSYLNQNYNEESSQSESEETNQNQKIQKTQVFNYDKFFNRNQDIQKAQEHIDLLTEYDLTQNNINPYLIYGFENDLDWSKVHPEHVYNMIYQMVFSHNSSQSYKIFEITNLSFLEKLSDFIKSKYELYNKTNKKQDKFFVQTNFFEQFTIDQLDTIRNTLTKKNIEIKDKEFFKSYFSKVFSEELSAENQELLTNEEKLSNVLALYNYSKAKKFSKGLSQSLLHEILTLSIKCDDYKEDLFLEYLQNPMEKNYELKQKSVIQLNEKAKQKRSDWNQCLQNVQSKQTKERFQNWEKVDNENDVIPKYLHYLCVKNNGSLSEKFSDYFNQSYLKQIERKVQVYQTDRGLLELGDDFDHNEYKRIQDEVILKFKETNKDQFKVNEKVVLQLDIKNIPELIIRIYEFNTETYYKKNLQPFDSSIDFQGLEPSYQRIESEKFSNVKKNKILTETFEFDELKDKIGLFIIEFQGNGLKSRAVIKKGSLSLIHRSTAGGHVAFIIDADRQICKSEGTGVWIEKKFYPCNLEKNGAISIPYISDGPKQTKIIMIHQGFAQLGEFLNNTEKYDFDVFYHVNSESILVGQEAHILIRPCLSINGRKTSVKQLKNAKIELIILDFNNIPTKLTFNDLKFNDNEEKIISFQVPLNSSQFSIVWLAQVQNATLKKLQDFNSKKKTILIQEHKNSYQLKELYLRKIGKNYFIYCLGRNGEPQTNGSININVKHMNKESTVQENLEVDKNGRVDLGELKDIEFVRAQIDISYNIQETWFINQIDGDIWSIPEEMNIIEGESIEIPVNFEGDQLFRHQAYLLLKRDGKIIKNMFERINLIKSDRGGQYKMIQLQSLESGEYTLKLKMSATQLITVNITVHKGTYWEDNFILKKNCLIESFSRKNGIRLESIKFNEKENPQQNQSELYIQLSNYSNQTRVHLYAMQFVANSSASLSNQLQKSSQEQIQMTRFPFAKWTNMFDSQQEMSDEIRYVQKRKLKENMMGNVLDRPSLLMKKQFVQFTQTENEKLKQGTQFQKADNQNDYDRSAEIKQSQHQSKMKEFHKRKVAAYHDDYQFNQSENHSNKIKDYQNFLSCAPIQLFNLKPNEQGIVQANLQEIQNYSQIFIVACDNTSVCQRELSVKLLLENQKNENEIPKRDLSQNKKVDDAGLIEQRQQLPLEKESQIHIEDITSSKIQIIDTLQKIYQIVELNLLTKRSSIDQKLNELIQDSLLIWHTLDFDKKIKAYSRFQSHELDFFIFKKDKLFFQQVVLQKVEAKMEKTFVDWYLLSQDNQSYSKYFQDKILKVINDHSQIQDLNTFEICLLIEVCLKFGQNEAKNKAQKLGKLINELANRENDLKMKEKHTIDKNIRIFEAILNLTDLDKDNKIDLNDIATRLNQEELINLQSVQECAQISNDPFSQLFSMNQVFGDQRSLDNFQNFQPMMVRGVQPMMMQNIQPMMVQNIQPMMMQNIQPMMVQNIQPRSVQLAAAGLQYQNQSIPYLKENESKGIFAQYDQDYNDEYHNSYQLQGKSQALNKVAFQEVEKTSEYMETHYFNLSSAGPFKHRFSQNQLYTDYIQYLVDQSNQIQSKKQFITSSFTEIEAIDLPILLSLIEIPQERQQSHKFKSDGKRGIFITLNCNSVIFKKEIKEGECKIKNDLMIIHRYTSLQNSNTEDDLEDFIINHPYQCEVIMTNVSSKHKQVTLLMQIPNGSLPLQKSKYIESKTISINPFSTIKENIQFYFPKEGTFEHYPSNISENGQVVSKASVKQFEVGKKQIIKKIQTFQHLMMMQNSDEKRKKKIIELLQNDFTKKFEPDFQFNQQSEIQYYIYSDIDFALEIIQIFDENMMFIFEFINHAQHHFIKVLEEEKYKEKRGLIIKYINQILQEKNKQDTSLFSYVMKPIDNQIINVQEHNILDIKYKHLEYFPMVNSRVFSVGGQDDQDDKDNQKLQQNKQILNVQFRQTYYRFLHLASHQDYCKEAEKQNNLNLNSKLKLQLVYFLQLQDRIEQAVNVFKQISINDIQNGGENDKTCLILYDYMRAYFDFYNSEIYEQSSSLIIRFQVARDIIKKYESCHIQSFEIAFKKIKEQLEELDQSAPQVIQKIDLFQTDDITEEQKRIALQQSKNKQPQIHEIKIDQNSGELKIESVNIDSFTVKYYLIDTEILFSRSPFVQNQAETFSYVKPCYELKKQAINGQLTQIELPTQLVGKNLVIEINSNDIQKFKTFYSSKIVVQCNEEYGELRACHQETKQALPKVYVKVFSKNNSGQDVFFRDGFTDIRGKFEYASASGKSLKDISKFAIFVHHDQYGSLIKEVDTPKNQ